MDSNMMQPSVYGDFSSNPFDDSVGGFNNIYNDPTKTIEEKLEAGAYDVPSHSGPAYDSDGFPEATNNQNELSGQIDSNSELIDSKKMQGSLSDVALTNGDEPSKKSVIGDDADDNKDDTVDKNELAPEEKQFKAGFWHPMKCYTHSILQVSGTRFYIHWSLIALVVIQLALSLAWPGYWPQFHLWLGFRIISPVFYFVNLILISTLAIFITKWKFKGKYYYFVLFCFGIFNRLKTDIDGFKARIMYYLLVPVLHIVFAIFWWILATIGGENPSLIWNVNDLSGDFISKVLIYQRNLNILCVIVGLLPMPSTFGGCIYVSLLQYYRGWSVTKACVLLVFLSIISLVILTFVWISRFSEIEFLFIVIWGTWQLLEFMWKGKESSGMKSMVLTSIVKHTVKEQAKSMQNNANLQQESDNSQSNDKGEASLTDGNNVPL